MVKIQRSRDPTAIPLPPRAAEEVMEVKVWYPAQPSKKGTRSQYINYDAAGKILHVGMSSAFPQFISSHVSLSKAHSFANAAPLMSPTEPSFPLLLLSHGMYGLPEIYTIFGEELASHGFVVCGPAHTDCSSLNNFQSHKSVADSVDEWVFHNRQLLIRSLDMQAILEFLSKQKNDELFSRIDFSRVGAFGHSFGAATAVKTMIDSNGPMIDCVVGLDPWLYSLNEDDFKAPLQKVLFLASPLWQWKANIERIERTFGNAEPGSLSAYMLGTRHGTFSDLPYYAHPFVLNVLKMVDKTERTIAVRAISDLMVSFFKDNLLSSQNRQLKDKRAVSSALLQQAVARNGSLLEIVKKI